MAKIQDKFYNRIIEGKIVELSESEKEELGLVSKESLVSDLENKDVIVKTIEQSEANWELDLSNIEVKGLGDLVNAFSFAKIQKFNRVLYFVINGVISNPTENPITNGAYIDIDLSQQEEIAKKIFNTQGENVWEATKTAGISGYAVLYSNADGDVFLNNVYKYMESRAGDKTIRMFITPSNVALAGGKYYCYSLRTFLIL